MRERNVYKNTNGIKITDGRIQVGGKRAKPLIADYILVYKCIKLESVIAKKENGRWKLQQLHSTTVKN